MVFLFIIAMLILLVPMNQRFFFEEETVEKWWQRIRWISFAYVILFLLYRFFTG